MKINKMSKFWDLTEILWHDTRSRLETDYTKMAAPRHFEMQVTIYKSTLPEISENSTRPTSSEGNITNYIL
jgi:uncharacterized membrane protein YgcG